MIKLRHGTTVFVPRFQEVGTIIIRGTPHPLVTRYRVRLADGRVLRLRTNEFRPVKKPQAPETPAPESITQKLRKKFPK